MSEFVPLARIVRRITDDHSDAHLGELRSIILSVLDTYATIHFIATCVVIYDFTFDQVVV